MQDAFEGLGRRLVRVAWMAVAEHLRQVREDDLAASTGSGEQSEIGGADPTPPSTLSNRAADPTGT